ncbi:MAG: aldo/keto reductase [Spirochaetales bacterium]|nr:aldo/keto reductase [Spirochaetales bacterium]
MKYKKVDKIDYEFSVLGFGCWGASGSGSWSDHGDQEQVRAIETAIDQGINFFDVAPVYGLGHAEEVLAQGIKGKRDKVFIATKVGLPWNNKFEAYNDVSAINIAREIDDSLRRLDVDYVDLYQVHWPSDKGVPLEETIEAMKRVQESGKARYLGLSNYSAADYRKACEITEIASMQGLFNMMEQNADAYHNIPLQYRVSDEIFPLVREEGLAFFPYSPLFQGLLTGKITRETVFGSNDVRINNPKLQGAERLKHLDVLDQIRNLEPLKGKSLPEIAVNYLVAKKEVTSVIATQATSDEVLANVNALEWQMDDETVSSIDALVQEKLG